MYTLTASNRYCGICVVFPEPVSPSMIRTYRGIPLKIRVPVQSYACMQKDKWRFSDLFHVSKALHIHVKAGCHPVAIAQVVEH